MDLARVRTTPTPRRMEDTCNVLTPVTRTYPHFGEVGQGTNDRCHVRLGRPPLDAYGQGVV